MAQTVQRRRFNVWDGMALAGMLAMGALLVLAWPTIPGVIAIHFGLRGEPNGYGSRDWLFLPLGSAAVLWTGLWLLRQVPRFFNLPAAPGSSQRTGQELLAVRMIAVLGAVLVWMLAALDAMEVAAAHGHRTRWTIALAPTATIATLGPVAWFLRRVRARRQLPQVFRYTGPRGNCSDGAHGVLHEVQAGDGRSGRAAV